MYYHFPSKEAIAEHLVSDWNHTLAETISEALAASPSSTAREKLTAIFISLAQHIGEDTYLRAGMKLTLEPAINNGAAFAHWSTPSATSSKPPSPPAKSPTPPTAHRLAWNLCAGTIGAAHASAVMREDIDLATRIGDTVAAHIKSVSA